MDREVPMLGGINSGFYAQGISAMDSSCKLWRGRPHGGIAVLWRKSLGQCCKIIDCDDTRLMAVQLTSESKTLLLVNVYMPCDSADSEEVFLYCLS
jgi:hypothetical protein